MWDRRVVEKVEEVVGHFLVSCKFKNVGNQFEMGFYRRIWTKFEQKA